MKPIERTLELAGTVHEVQIQPAGEAVGEAAGEADDGRVTVTIDDADPVEATLPGDISGPFTLRMGGKRHRVAVARDGNTVEVCVDGRRFVLRPTARATGQATTADTGGPVRAPMPGKVVELPVAVGDRVEAGDPVAVVEAMKLRSSLPATATGTVSAIPCAVGDQVNAGQVLVEIEEEGKEE
jgi:acetyl-CoA/propionyl-CoA carboxylase, biotin carboxylase, biotin carboxyl carrier protein